MSHRNSWSFGIALILLTIAAAALAEPVDREPRPRRLDQRLDLMSGGAALMIDGAVPWGFTGFGSQQSLPEGLPRLGVNVRVNDLQTPPPAGLFGRSETSLAVGRDGRRLVAAWNDVDGFCFLFPGFCTSIPQVGNVGFGYSADGGETWADGGAPPLFDGIYTGGDPWLDRGGFDGETYYLSSLGFNLFTGQIGILGIHRGHFTPTGQFAWEDVRVIAPGKPLDFLDKEAIAAAKDGSGQVVLSATNFVERCGQLGFGFGQIEVWRSTDAGDTWSGPAIVGEDMTFDIDPDSPTCGATGLSQQSSSPALGPGGEVYVVWERGPTLELTGVSPQAEIVVAASLDGGVTWHDPVIVAEINHMRGAPPVAYNRNEINNHPRIAVAAGGSAKGRVYVTFSSMESPVAGESVSIPCPAGGPNDLPCVAQNLTSSQVFLSHSDDAGATWSTPVPLAGPVPPEGVKRWWPTVGVQPNGAVDVVYYEAREEGLTPDPDDIECGMRLRGGLLRVGEAVSLVDTYWVRSVDGGRSFGPPARVSDVSTNWCQVISNLFPNMGDYIFNASVKNRAYPIWADGRDGIPDVFFAVGLDGAGGD